MKSDSALSSQIVQYDSICIMKTATQRRGSYITGAISVGSSCLRAITRATVRGHRSGLVSHMYDVSGSRCAWYANSNECAMSADGLLGAEKSPMYAGTKYVKYIYVRM